MISRVRHEIPRIFSWMTKGMWAVSDQAFFAGTSLIANILLARWMEISVYGAFSTGLAIVVLIVAVHDALLVEPMLPLGARRYRHTFSLYVRTLLIAHVGYSMVCALLILPGLFLTSSPLSRSLAAIALCLPLLLAPWLLRKVAYVLMQPRIAAESACVYFCAVIAGLALLKQHDILSAWSAFFALGIAGLLSSVHLLKRIPLALDAPSAEHFVHGVVADHWRFARWTVGKAVLHWTPTNLFYFLIPVYVGISGSASLRAMMTLVLPLLFIYAALLNLLIPKLSVGFSRSTSDRSRLIRLSLGLVLLSSSAFWLLLYFHSETLVGGLYGDRYASYSSLLLVLGLLPLIEGVRTVICADCLAQERPDVIFWCFFSIAVCALLVAVPAVKTGGVLGAAFAIVVSNLVGTVFIVVRYFSTALSSGSFVGVLAPTAPSIR